VRLVLVALAALVAACAPASVPPLRVTRYSIIPENHYPAVERSVADAAAARRAYDAIRALRPRRIIASVRRASASDTD